MAIQSKLWVGILSGILILGLALVFYMKAIVPWIRWTEGRLRMEGTIDSLVLRLNLDKYRDHVDYINALLDKRLSFEEFVTLYDEKYISPHIMKRVLENIPGPYLREIQTNKQYLKIIDGRPLMQETIRRLPPYVPPGASILSSGIIEAGVGPAPAGLGTGNASGTFDMIIGSTSDALGAGDFIAPKPREEPRWEDMEIVY